MAGDWTEPAGDDPEFHSFCLPATDHRPGFTTFPDSPGTARDTWRTKTSPPGDGSDSLSIAPPNWGKQQKGKTAVKSGGYQVASWYNRVAEFKLRIPPHSNSDVISRFGE